MTRDCAALGATGLRSRTVATLDGTHALSLTLMPPNGSR